MMYLLQAKGTSFMNMPIHIKWFTTNDNEQPNGTIYQSNNRVWWTTNYKNTKINTIGEVLGVQHFFQLKEVVYPTFVITHVDAN
jgi:hypothetical protein